MEKLCSAADYALSAFAGSWAVAIIVGVIYGSIYGCYELREYKKDLQYRDFTRKTSR
jgi:hypothetical protein